MRSNKINALVVDIHDLESKSAPRRVLRHYRDPENHPKDRSGVTSCESAPDAGSVAPRDREGGAAGERITSTG
jgi:hypothetical protein